MGKFLIKNFELFLYAEIWYLGYFDYVQFDGDVGFFLFEAGNTFFWVPLAQKNQNYSHQLKFGTEFNSTTLNLMVIITFSILDRRYPFWQYLVQKFKLVCLR